MHGGCIRCAVIDAETPTPCGINPISPSTHRFCITGGRLSVDVDRPMPLKINAEAPSSNASSPRPAGDAMPMACASRTPHKALVGGVLIGVVVGGFVSPMAAKISAFYPATVATYASPAQISSSATARAQIQDARAAAVDGASETAISVHAGQPAVTLSNAGGEVDR